MVGIKNLVPRILRAKLQFSFISNHLAIYFYIGLWPNWKLILVWAVTQLKLNFRLGCEAMVGVEVLKLKSKLNLMFNLKLNSKLNSKLNLKLNSQFKLKLNLKRILKLYSKMNCLSQAQSGWMDTKFGLVLPHQPTPSTTTNLHLT